MYYVGTYVIIILRYGYNNCHNNNIIKDIDIYVYVLCVFVLSIMDTSTSRGYITHIYLY